MDRNRGGTARRGRLLDTTIFRQHAADGRVVLVVVVEAANASDSGTRTNIIIESGFQFMNRRLKFFVRNRCVSDSFLMRILKF
jgi:hypothetical protein